MTTKYGQLFLTLLCLLMLFGCVRRGDNSHDAGNSQTHGNPTAHPLAAANDTVAELRGEAKAARWICGLGIFVSAAAGLILRTYIPGTLALGGSIAAAFALLWALATVVSFLAPFGLWLALVLLLLSAALLLWHFRRWILAP